MVAAIQGLFWWRPAAASAGFLVAGLRRRQAGMQRRSVYHISSW